MRILKKRRVTWAFSYAYFEGMELLGHAECPSNYPFLQNTYRRMSKLLHSFKIRIGECPSNSPFLQNTHRRMWRNGVTWTFSYTYFERKDSYLDILLCVFWRKGELLGHSPMRILKERKGTWIFSYAYFEGMELLGHSVQVTILSFKTRIGECPSNSPFLQNTHRRMSK
jgi:hypothetical protein